MPAALISGAVLIYAAAVLRSAFRIGEETYFSLFDDAMISMRYARNLAEGHGLRWNIGEPPVEGFTNFLWTLWMAVLHLLPVPDSKVSLLVMLSGIVILAANLWVVYRITLAVSDGSRLAAAIALTFVALYYPLVFWTLRGMEVGLLTLIVNGGILVSLAMDREFRTDRLAALLALFVAAILVRPDGFIPFAAIGGFVVMTAGPARRILVGLSFAATFLGATGLLTAFRLVYYGSPVPNTYYLKIDGASTLERLQVGLDALSSTAFLHLGIPIFLTLALGRRLLDPRFLLLSGVFLIQCAYSAYVGGDAWEWMNYANRYISVGVPALLVVSACGLVALGEGKSRLSDTTSRNLILGGASAAAVLFFVFALGSNSDATLLGRYSAPRLAAAILFLTASLGLLLALRKLRLFQRRTAAFWALALLVLMQTAGGPLFGWAFLHGSSAANFRNDVGMTRTGVATRFATGEDATIAVVQAGALPYFARRTSVDLLGKSDPVIARSEPRVAFNPGHNKWDYSYSIATLQPDLVLQLQYPTAAERQLILDAGYEYLGWDGGWSDVYVRTDSDGVDRLLLRETLQLAPTALPDRGYDPGVRQ
ncbi:MAG: hypothetical protein WD766_02710 [Gemmatimonadota bacterium]